MPCTLPVVRRPLADWRRCSCCLACWATPWLDPIDFLVQSKILDEVGGDALTFFLLQADRGIEQHFLLVLLHFLQLQLITDHFTLMKNDENDKADG